MTIRRLSILLFLFFQALCGPGQAQGRIEAVDVATSGWFSRETVVTVALDEPVPFRVGAQTTDGLVHVDLEGGSADTQARIATDSVLGSVRMGRADFETARLTLGFQREVALQSAVMSLTEAGASLVMVFDVSKRRVAGRAPDRPEEAGGPVIVLDPGHGGIDPGAVRDGVSEKDIALAFGLELRAALEEAGNYTVIMTRDTDIFLTLRERVRVARAAGGAAFLSLHANTVTRGNASGAAVYTLSAEASSAEAAALAALENRADSVGGAALDAGDDDLALLLTDMTQRQTNARSIRLADALVEGLDQTVGVIRTNPHRSAGFRVLKAPDIPSVLVELGFLSDDGDRAAMISARWRAQAIGGIIASLDAWAAQDSVLAGDVTSE